MTNSTTPLPVQEPAGAVETIMALAAKFAEAYAKLHFARQCGHGYTRAGEEAEAAREALRSALSSLQPVTQEKSEPVAWAARGKDGKPKFGAGWIFSKVQNDTANMPLYDAPQEAMERRPLTDAEIDHVLGITAGRNISLEITLRSVFRAAEGAHGIGPATQEAQHG